MRVVCISDTHLEGPNISIPEGDLLIHAGDHTIYGKMEELKKAGEWLSSLPHRWKITIPGNHDKLFEKEEFLARCYMMDALGGVRILIDQETEVEGLRIWGSPWTPRYGSWAFQLDGQPKPRRTFQLNHPESRTAEEHWDKIPEGLDILITHGPPFGILDTTKGQHVGDGALLKAVKEKKPRFNIFGHIHDGYGVWEEDGITFVNAAILDDLYDPVHKPVVLDIHPKGDMMKVKEEGGEK